MDSVAAIASQLDPQQAREAMAAILVALGRHKSWNADTFMAVTHAIETTGVAANLPAAFDQSDSDADYWDRVHQAESAGKVSH